MKLFISYRSLDSAKVDTIVARLRSLKKADNMPLYTVWQDKTDIPDGHDWWEAIVDAIVDCDIFIFMLSRESANNINCRAEMSYAYKRNRPILPLVLENEFVYNPTTGKNDINYWKDIPDELNDIRAQILFYEGTSFVKRIEESVAHFQHEPQRWRDIPADRPRDPRHASEATNNTAVLYDEACDYALRLEINTAERLFQKLVRMNDPDFGEDAHEWILLLREYQKLLTFDARESTRHRVQPNWLAYTRKFPKPFVKFFDPKNFKARYDNVVVSNDSQVSTVTTTPKLSLISNILPAPFDLIEIPKGSVTVNGKNETIEMFHIAKYPVTNAQYAKFIAAGGYSQKKWWTDDGWSVCQLGLFVQRDGWRPSGIPWSSPRYWQDSKWNGALQPVVGVSWYEAVAFCNWLDDTLATLSIISTMKITLPTEQQWQRAAQGDDGRIYPWGNDWDCQRCNNSVAPCNSIVTTSVNHYEGDDKGNSYFGVVDMVGNVLEWCKTAYDTGSNDINGTGMRVLRGGCFNFDSNFSVTFRDDRMESYDEAFFAGFRIVVS